MKVCKVRVIFKMKILREEAKRNYKGGTSQCLSTQRSKSGKECNPGKGRIYTEHSLNRSTNAAAESLKSEIKGFRVKLDVIADIAFFLYRS